MELKDLIKSRRLALNLTLEEVAAQVGVSKATVSRWESGNISNMRRDRIAKLAAALHTNPDYIMGCSDDPEPITEKPAPVAESELSDLQKQAVQFVMSLSDDQLRQFIRIGKALISENQ